MRYLVAALIVLFASSAIAADAPTSQPSPIAASIDRGLAFLAKDAVAWREEHHCVSCHHASLVVWAMREAKQAGRAVDEPLLADLTKWIAESGDGKTGVPRPEGIPQALNEKAVSLALALAADPQPDAVSQAGIKILLQTVKSDQIENGSWASWPDTRHPIFGNSDERTTLSATLALLAAAAGGDEPARAARDRGLAWLDATKTDDDPQSVALRLVLWRRLDRPAELWQPLVERIRARQNADGGWSQASDMPSDAWATGQALYALSHAGLKSGDPAVERGQAFLVATQRDDGSWPMTSRPIKPGDKGATSLIPITGAGSSWAVLGLVRSR
jgi:Squalene-hopene cyclase N-terminal domain